MNNRDGKMLEILKRGKNEFGYIVVKAEFGTEELVAMNWFVCPISSVAANLQLLHE